MYCTKQQYIWSVFEGVEGVVVKSSPSIEDNSWNIEKGAKKKIALF